MGLKDYTDTKNGPQLAVLKHAVIGDRIGEVKIEKRLPKIQRNDDRQTYQGSASLYHGRMRLRRL